MTEAIRNLGAFQCCGNHGDCRIHWC